MKKILAIIMALGLMTCTAQTMGQKTEIKPAPPPAPTHEQVLEDKTVEDIMNWWEGSEQFKFISFMKDTFGDDLKLETREIKAMSNGKLGVIWTFSEVGPSSADVYLIVTKKGNGWVVTEMVVDQYPDKQEVSPDEHKL